MYHQNTKADKMRYIKMQMTSKIFMQGNIRTMQSVFAKT